jgi:hypothetical protein
LTGEAAAAPLAPRDDSAREDLIRALEEALRSLRAEPGEAAEQARAVAALRHLERARAADARGEARTEARAAARARDAEQRLQRVHERRLQATQRVQDVNVDRARIAIERQRALEQRTIARGDAVVAGTREEALLRQIEVLEAQQEELRRMIVELRRTRGKLPE